MANKSIKLIVMGGIALSLITLQTTNVSAQAHVHGQGQLFVAQEDKQWQFEFNLPAADLLGFEHAPETQAQKDKLNLLTQQIGDLNNVVVLPNYCVLTQTSNSLDSLLSTVSEVNGEKHAHEEHKHDDSKHEHDHEHEHSHDGHKGHADIKMSYFFECDEDLMQAQIKIFSIAPSLQTIEAQWITNKGQGAQETNESASTVRF